VGAYCGVDIGTTNTKVMLIDGAGRVLSRVTEPTPRTSDEIGPCADPERIVGFVEELIMRAAAQNGMRSPLRSICVAGIGEDGVTVDATGKPLGLAIPWFDNRADAEAKSLRDVAVPFEAQSGIRIDSTRTAAKWLWLSGHAPDTSYRAKWIALTDYPAFAWTGNAFMSETLAARTGCYDCRERRWIPQLLTAAHAPTLPPIALAGQVIGTISSGPLLANGLADRRTAVVAGGHDHPMAASVTLDIDARSVLDSMGTAELVYAESSPPSATADPDVGLPYLARSVPVGGGPGFAYLGVFEFTAILAPFMNDSSPCGAALRAVSAGSSVPGTPGAGARFYPGTEANGAHEFFGVDRSESGARAILEGCAMYTRRVLEALADAGLHIGPIYATGGWTQSPSLLALRAAVLGKPLHVVDEPQLGALGAARCGARAVDNDGAVMRDVLSTRTVTNDETLDRLYSDLYADYRAHFDRRDVHTEPSSTGKR
jgi:xylulokinase